MSYLIKTEQNLTEVKDEKISQPSQQQVNTVTEIKIPVSSDKNEETSTNKCLFGVESKTLIGAGLVGILLYTLTGKKDEKK